MRTTELSFSEETPFYKVYIDTLGDVELLDILQRQLHHFPEFIESIPDEKLLFAYGPDKWTIAQVLVHVIDSERIFQYRALRFSRGDQNSLPGFDQDFYAERSKADRRSKESIIEEYKSVRKSTLALFATFDRDDLENSGTASHLQWSVAALGFVISGHQKHHRDIIRERYL
ncbi:hypothetical protein LCGC14_1175200 [marine sediment metagenome]|uniref:DinB family protein n=2 Tax=root TaxID=1 RepID=A0A831QRV3_9FLAO|nr:DinB family protein [Pricia sp.]HEA23443.1 DinB family protein [Pricia antarctica]